MSQQFSAQKLNVNRGQKKVLDSISMAVQAGELISLLGANGAGKSTFLSVLSGELQANSSENKNVIYINGESFSLLCSAKQAKLRAVLPQKQSLNFNLKVYDVIAMGAYPFPSLTSDKVSQLKQQAINYAQAQPLQHCLYSELSGGEQQRIQYARVILQVLCGLEENSAAQYLLLDEPISNLDPKYQHALLKTAKQLSIEKNIGVLIILHDVNIASMYSDRIALLSDGRLLACGTPQQTLSQQNLEKAYDMNVKILPHPLMEECPWVHFYS